MPVLFNNNAITTLNGAITAGATSITVTAAGVFPAVSAPDYIYLTITEAAKIEIIKVTDITGNVLTAVRGQDGTTAQAFATLSRIDLRLTAITLIDALADNILSDAAIKTAYENNTNTNAFTDALLSKLGAIEALADVTDTANVTAAGALMDSEIDANLKTFSLPASTSISTYIQTLLDDANAATARSTLGVDAAGTINYTHPNHTGDVTSTGDGATVIANNVVTLAKLADIATASILGRTTAATGDPEVLTATQARAILNVEDGADVTDATNVAASGAMMDSDISPAEGFLRKTGAGAYTAIKSNIGATVAPTVNEDSGDGYAIGSIWIDTTANKIWQAVDVTVAAAVWIDITASGAVIASQAEAEAGTDNTKMMTPLRVQQSIDDQPAGWITQTDIASAAVGQAELKTTTGEVSHSTVIVANVVQAGGEYGLYPNCRQSGGGGVTASILASPLIGTGSTNYVAITGSNSPATTITVRQRYIQASPPYDLGDGSVHSFLFAVVDNGSGLIESTYFAADPPWANNGPTNIRPDRIDKVTGKMYKTVRTLLPNKTSFMSPNYVAEQEIELTAEFKNSDMGLIPHPFIDNDLTGKTVVMIDPMSPVVERLELLKNQGEDTVDIIQNYINIGNVEIGRYRPSGVMSVAITLK